MDRDTPAADVCVIGGGLAGLTTACYLARAGIGVTLFERSAALGGRAATQYRSGFAFNRGIHGLYPGGAADEVLQELGVSYSYGTPTDIWVHHGGRFYPFPASPRTLLASRMLSLRDKWELARVFAMLPRVDAHALASTSVDEWLTTVRRPLVRRFMAHLAQPYVYTSALDLISAEVFVDKVQRALRHPVRYIDGGWQTLVDGLRTLAEDSGVAIVSGSSVERVEHANGQVHGVRLRDGSRLAAAAVVLATDPHAANKLIDGGGYAPVRALVEQLVPAVVACLDVAVQQLSRTSPALVQDLDRPQFLAIQSLYASVAPEGRGLLSVFKQLDPRLATDGHADEAELEALLDTAQPGWRHVTVERQFLPRIAAAGALPLASSGGFAGRPGHTVPGIANCYLAGDWIGPEGFLSDASLASARAVARRLITARPRRAAPIEAAA